MTEALLYSLTTILILLTIVTVFKIVKMVIDYVHLRNDDYEEDHLQGEPDDKNFPMFSGFRLSTFTRFNGDEILTVSLGRYQASVTQSKILDATFDEILEVVRPLLESEKEANTIRHELEEFPKEKHCSGIISRVRVNDKGQYGITVSGITHNKSPVGPVALYHRLTIIGDVKVEDITALLKKRVN